MAQMARRTSATAATAAAAAIGALALVVGTTHATPGPGVFALYYNTQWSPAYLHYNPDNAGWNPIPGAAMAASSNTSFPSSQGWQYLEVGANAAVFVLTDGHNNWDNNGGKNYDVTAPGVYALKSGTLQTIQTFTKACPGSPTQCSGHGTCSSSTFTCSCDAGYWGPACAGTCPGGVSNACDGHGTCSQVDGTCTCATGYASCSAAKDCSSDVSSDPDNCGGCNMTCKVGPGVAKATCSDATCHRTCASGYTLCADGTCHMGSDCPLPGCQTYTENQCTGNTIVTDPSFADRMWQTPPKGGDGYRASYQDMTSLVGHAGIVYGADRKTATVTLWAIVKDTSVALTYSFDGVQQHGPNKTYAASDADAAAAGLVAGSYSITSAPINVSVSGSDGSSLVLEAVDLLWNNPPVAAREGDYRGGQKGGIVEMFGWPDADVAAECADLAKFGYMGVKVYPIQEQVMSSEPFQNVLNPWYFMYQPVSYRLAGRMGSRDDVRKMTAACRSVGVRVYADAVVNHMVGSGNDGRLTHRDNNCVMWGPKNSSAGEAVSPFYTQGFAYETNAQTGKAPLQEFPAVPYGPLDFHCERALNSWTSPLDLNAGWLTGLTDLNTERTNVQQRIADYLTDLLSIGFSGFRIDAAKHMKPDDLTAIFAKLKYNLGGSLPSDFIVWQEILLGGEADMLLCNAASGYNYGKYYETALSNAGFTAAEIDQLKIWFSAYPKQPGADCGALNMQRKVIQNDDADQQMPGSSSRDMQSYGSVLVKDRDIPKHRGFEVQLFTSPRGSTDNDNDYPIRVVLSSYYFDIAQQPYGIPDGKSDCALCRGDQCGTCRTMNRSVAHQPSAQGYAGPVYTRVHRDTAIVNAMRSWMHLSALDEE